MKFTPAGTIAGLTGRVTISPCERNGFASHTFSVSVPLALIVKRLMR